MNPSPDLSGRKLSLLVSDSFLDINYISCHGATSDNLEAYEAYKLWTLEHWACRSRTRPAPAARFAECGKLGILDAKNLTGLRPWFSRPEDLLHDSTSFA